MLDNEFLSAPLNFVVEIGKVSTGTATDNAATEIAMKATESQVTLACQSLGGSSTLEANGNANSLLCEASVNRGATAFLETIVG
ncbi:unnamed protein product [Notodromas monacha]|uniref:Uncharacterized protein n=1 Tax=Notodromas monacha TaxID=399045 RepID=A0A7R9BJ21_9CRUS|nr:unnamed protein product [Notodromas monacha]CAG0915617.1 unnamed protein product [Notodromas monacha]